MLNNIDYALAGTESSSQVWREKGYLGEMAVVPQFGTDPDLFTPRNRIRRAGSETSRIEEDEQRPFTIGYVGRLVEEKGIHLLLQAAAQLTGEWCFRLVGSGPYKSELAGAGGTTAYHGSHRVDRVGGLNRYAQPISSAGCAGRFPH